MPQYHAVAKRKQKFTLPKSSVQVFAYGSSGPLAIDSPVFTNPAKQQDAPKIELLLLWTEQGRMLFDSLALRGVSQAHLPIKAIKRLLKTYKTRQFIGTQSQYKFLENLYKFRFTKQKYWIMVRNNQSTIFRCDRSPPLDKIDNRLQIKRLTQADLAQLLPLEWAYYQEEVIQSPISGSHYSIIERNCTKRLKQFLQYGIFSGSELIARAMINAYGLYYWQIGGFYTVPRWRGKGLGGILLQKLCAAIEQARRSAMLFVRQDNAAALHLYKKHSFVITEHMVIAQDSDY